MRLASIAYHATGVSMLAMRWILGGVLPMTLLGAGCREQSFWCQRTAEVEGRPLRCQSSQDGCEKYLAQRKGGCDPKPEAWCFYESPMGGLDPELVCAISETDCLNWRRAKKKREPSECKRTPAGSW